jgi:hypothetical protein
MVPAHGSSLKPYPTPPQATRATHPASSFAWMVRASKDCQRLRAHAPLARLSVIPNEPTSITHAIDSTRGPRTPRRFFARPPRLADFEQRARTSLRDEAPDPQPTSPSCRSCYGGPEHPATTLQWWAEGLLHYSLSPPRPRPRACRSAPVVGATRWDDARRLISSPATRRGAWLLTSPSCLKYCVSRELLPALQNLKAQRAQPLALQAATAAKVLWAA